MRIILLLCCAALFCSGKKESEFSRLSRQFSKDLEQLKLPEFSLDHREYFNGIGSISFVEKQISFYKDYDRRLKSLSISDSEKKYAAHLQYEIDFGLKRTQLERKWLSTGGIMPSGGLSSLGSSAQEWYHLFVLKFCSIALEPEVIVKYGKSELERLKGQLRELKIDSADTMTIRSKEHLQLRFKQADSIVRKNLQDFPSFAIPEIYPMEWPDAGPYTPPGIYLSKESSGYPKDVFQFNFYQNRFYEKNIDWLYMHEGIPGHHLQSSYRKLLKPYAFQEQFTYPGSFEGWACYIEYLGPRMNLMADQLQKIGHIKWEMIRSIRLILDAGIHFYGWDRSQCQEFWKSALPDDLHGLAEREITRVTNWPAQALSYKVGAKVIEELAERSLEKGESLKDFHTFYLDHSYFPLQVIRAFHQD